MIREGDVQKCWKEYFKGLSNADEVEWVTVNICARKSNYVVTGVLWSHKI